MRYTRFDSRQVKTHIILWICVRSRLRKTAYELHYDGSNIQIMTNIAQLGQMTNHIV